MCSKTSSIFILQLRRLVKMTNPLKYLIAISARWWSHQRSQVATNFNRQWIPITNLASLILNLVPLTTILPIFFIPRHPVYVPNIFPHNTLVYFVVYIVYIPSLTYYMYHLAYLMKTIIFESCAFFIFLLPLIRDELNLENNNLNRNFQCAPDLRMNPENIVLVYRSLQLIMKLVASAVGPYIPLTQALFGQMFISTGYVLIVEGKNLNVSLSLFLLSCIPFAMIFWVIFLSFAAKVDKGSRICIRSWKSGGTGWSKQETKYIGKFIKSCKSLFFGYPGIMTITHKTVVKFIQGNIRGLFRLVLTFKR